MNWGYDKGSILYDYRLDDVVLSECDLAYISGLLDVEASFLVKKRSSDRGYFLQVHYNKTDWDTLKYIADLFGANVKTVKRKKGEKELWSFSLSSRKAYRLINQIYPMLIIRKKTADLCMEFLEQYWMSDARGKPVSEERKLIGAKYEALLKEHYLKSWPRS